MQVNCDELNWMASSSSFFSFFFFPVFVYLFYFLNGC
jgi:hypothetical protein